MDCTVKRNYSHCFLTMVYNGRNRTPKMPICALPYTVYILPKGTFSAPDLLY